MATEGEGSAPTIDEGKLPGGFRGFENSDLNRLTDSSPSSSSSSLFQAH
jgi:hypothetical protein